MKNNAWTFVKYALGIVVNQLIAIVMSVFVTTVIGFFSSDGLPFFRFILTSVIYVALLYSTSWRKGSSDENRVKLGYLSDNKLRGFIAGLLAAIPGIVLAVFAFLSESGYVSFFEFMGHDGVVVINRFLNLPIGELYQFIEGRPALNILFPMVIPVVSGISYILGRYGISVRQILIYKADKE
ncbi:MAG: hypothetical protein IKM21_02740 [Oscillospiraceae bacterium]|nr:hypothetical protein [Oscillospiraceae bacterium]